MFDVLVNLGAGWINLSSYGGQNLVRFDGFEKTQQLHNDDFRSCLNVARFTMEMEMTLAPQLFERRANIDCVIMRQGVPWFSGFVRPVTELTVTPGPGKIDVEVFDKGIHLQRFPAADIEFSNIQICNPVNRPNSLVHQIMYAAGFTDADIDITLTIPQTLIVAGVVKSRTYWDQLDLVLFDHHHVFSFGDDGRLRVFNWAYDSPPTPIATLTGQQLLDTLLIRRREIDDDEVVVEYYNQHSQRIRLIHQSPDREGSAYVTVFEPAVPTFFNYHFPEGGIVLSVQNIALQFRWRWKTVLSAIHNYTDDHTDDGGVVAHVWQPEKYGARVQFRIKPVWSSNKLRWWRVDGDVIWLTEGNFSPTYKMTGSTGKLRTYKSTFLYNWADADKLARALLKCLEFARYTYEFRDGTEWQIGDVVQIADGKSNISQVVRIVRKIRIHGEAIATYEAVGIGAVTSQAGSVVVGTRGITDLITIAEGAARAMQGLDDSGAAVAGVNGPGMEGQITPTAAGLYFSREYLGFFDGTAWQVWIRDNGTFRFSGTPGHRIEWDGVRLQVHGDMYLSGSSELRGSVKVGTDIHNDGHIPGVSGWHISGAGDAEFRDAIFRGELQATTTTTIQGRVVEGQLAAARYVDEGLGWALLPDGRAFFHSGLRTNAVRGLESMEIYAGSYGALVAAGQNIGRAMPSSARVFAFEGSFADNLGADLWTTKQLLSFGPVSRYGDQALHGTSASSFLERLGWAGLRLSGPLTFEFWLFVDAAPDGAGLLFDVSSAEARITGVARHDRYIYASTDYAAGYWSNVPSDLKYYQLVWAGTGGVADAALPIVEMAWNYVGIAIAANGRLTAVVNQTVVWGDVNLPTVSGNCDVTFWLPSARGVVIDSLYVDPVAALTQTQMLANAVAQFGYGQLSDPNTLSLFAAGRLVVGRLHRQNGMTVTATITKVGPWTAGELWAALSPRVTVIGDQLMVSGGVRVSGAWVPALSVRLVTSSLIVIQHAAGDLSVTPTSSGEDVGITI